MEQEAKTAPKDTSKLVSYWLEEIRIYDKAFDDWNKRCDEIKKRYRDERDREDSGSKRTTSRYNILWANIQLLGPAVYFNLAKPWIERRFKDKAPVARRAASILERATSVNMEANQGEFQATILGCRDDWLLYARGQAWFRYEPKYEDGQERVPLTLTETSDGKSGYSDQDGNPLEVPNDAKVQQDDTGSFMMQPYQQVVYEQVRVDFVSRKDFGHCVADRWEQVYGVWRCLHMLKREVVAKFGQAIADKLIYDTVCEEQKDQSKDMPNYYEFAKASVYEVWSKKDKKVIWVSPSYKESILGSEDDPLGLEQFYPCPKPLFGTMTTDSLIPVPDFSQYQDQARELDDVTARIKILTALLALKGVTDAAHHNEVKKLMLSAENDIVPIKDWVRLQRDGGLEKIIEFFPLEEVAGVLKGLFEIRENIVDVIAQVEGLSDIMRGQTDPRETMGAQKTKSEYGNLRLKNKQEEIQRFVLECVAIEAEIIAEHFDPETLMMIAGEEQDQQDPQTFLQAVQLLKDESLRTFKIDIETDSTKAIDDDADKQAVNEFMTAMTAFVEQIANLNAAFPAAVPLMGEMMMFAARRFKAGRGLESSVERFVEQLTEAAAQPKQEPADPAAIKAQADAQQSQQDAQVKMHTEAMKAQIEQLRLALEKQKSEQDAVISQLEINSKESIEAAKLENKQAVEKMKLDYEALFKAAEERRKNAESEAKIESLKQPEQPFA